MKQSRFYDEDIEGLEFRSEIITQDEVNRANKLISSLQQPE